MTTANNNKMTKHLDPLTKQKILGAKIFCEAQGYKCSQRDLALTFNVTRKQVRTVLDPPPKKPRVSKFVIVTNTGETIPMPLPEVQPDSLDFVQGSEVPSENDPMSNLHTPQPPPEIDIELDPSL